MAQWKRRAGAQVKNRMLSFRADEALERALLRASLAVNMPPTQFLRAAAQAAVNRVLRETRTDEGSAT